MTVPKRRQARLPAGEIAYLDEGAGPAVVLLHGFPTSAHLWRDLVPMLAPRFRAIAPDLLGYGDSSKPADVDALTIRAQARMVRDLLEHLGIEEFSVVGHDIGGGVAQLLAFEGGVHTMALADTISLDSWPIEAVKMIAEASDEQVTEDFAADVARVAFDVGMSHRERLADEDLEEYLRPWRAEPLALVRAARAIDGEGLRDTEGRLRSLEQRVLVAWGEDDPFQGAEWAERLGELLPGATVALLPGCGHFITEDAPETVLPLISRYLETHELGGHAHAERTPVELGISFQRPARPSVPEGFEDIEED
jgi:2-hydroxymuconate-semialdehyde hydrolase